MSGSNSAERKRHEPLVLVETADLSEEDWLDYRRRGIGGSDVSAIFGTSPFRTARDLYYDKLNIASVEDDEGNWVAMEVGHLLEPLVAKIFERKTGYRVYQIKKMFQHPQYPWMLADVDYFVELPDGTTAILEIKTTNYNARDNWWMNGKETVPVYYESQGRHYMAVTDLDRCFFCCLYGNNEEEVIIREVKRDFEYEAEMVFLEQYFWENHVQRHVPPPYTESGALIIESARKHFGPADKNAPAVALDLDMTAKLMQYLRLLDEKKNAEVYSKEIDKDIQRLKALLIAEMGTSCTAVCEQEGVNYTVTYTPVRKSVIDKDTKAYWISDEDETSIQAYLNINKKAVEAIRQFQRDVRDEQLEQRHRRETDPWDKDMEQVPELPKDWSRWVDKVAILQNYIYYHYKKGGTKTGYCTYCEKEVPIKVHPHHNQQGRCICCRHPVVFKAYGRAGYMQTEKHFAYLIQRCKDGFVVREFQADRTYGKESLPNSKLYCQEIRRTIYDRERKPRTYYWGLYKQRNMRWISGSPCSYSWSGSHDGRVYGKTLPTLEQQELRCTGLVNWIRKQKSVDPEKYLAVLERIPQMEQISKVNLPKLTKECFSSCGTVSELIKNHSAGSLIKALGLDSRRFQRLRLHNGGCDLLRWLQYEKGIGREIPDNVLLWMCQQDIEPGDVQFIADRMSMVQVYNYVRRQMPSFRRNSHEVLRTWEDYLSMAKKLHMNVYDEIVYRTRKLRRRHDDLVLKCQEKDIELQAEEMEEKFPHVNAICQEIKAKYEYADADYMVVVPDGILDIITEGRALHHCAGSSDRYWDRIERRESFVVFLRKTADPFHAYYTLEVEPDGTVRQKRTEYDRQKKDIEQATEFLQKWQRVITARLTENDKALAAESRILREKEFIQLKKDRVIIHTGHLAGRLLADVLMADLMENTDSIQSPVLAAAA